MKIHLYTYHSPVGDLLLGATSTHLILCNWPDKNGNPRPSEIKRLNRLVQGEHEEREGGTECESGNPILHQTILQLNEYFHGTRQTFSLPIKTFGTPFQQQVWQQLQTIPYGTTITYKQQSAVLGCPQAVRAVANANRLNALSIIIPCHRVIGTNPRPLRDGQGGSSLLTGYAGGLEAKQWLINHESSVSKPNNDSINEKKGKDFEEYVVNHFNKKYFKLKEWRGDKYTNGRYAESNRYPDMEWEFHYRNFTAYFATECKWRFRFHDGRVQWSNDEQLGIYRSFEKEHKCTVYIVLGVGGSPSNPNAIYIIPLSSITSATLYESELKEFQYDFKHREFYYDMKENKLKFKLRVSPRRTRTSSLTSCNTSTPSDPT